MAGICYSYHSMFEVLTERLTGVLRLVALRRMPLTKPCETVGVKTTVALQYLVLCFVFCLGALGGQTARAGLTIEFVTDQYEVDRATERRIWVAVSSIYRVYSDALGLKQEQLLRVKIRIFGRLDSYKKYQKKVSKTARSEAGFYSRRLREVVVWKNKSTEKMLRTIHHESSHFILRDKIPKCPKWLNEGLAEFYETCTINGPSMIIKPQDKKDARTKRSVRDMSIMPLKEYLALSNKEWTKLNRRAENPASTIAWSLVYFLMSSDTGIRAVRGVMHSLSHEKSKTFSSVKAIDRAYPGGLVNLERDWHRWIPQKRRPLSGAAVIRLGKKSVRQ